MCLWLLFFNIFVGKVCFSSTSKNIKGIWTLFQGVGKTCELFYVASFGVECQITSLSSKHRHTAPHYSCTLRKKQFMPWKFVLVICKSKPISFETSVNMISEINIRMHKKLLLLLTIELLLLKEDFHRTSLYNSCLGLFHL